MNKGIDFVTTGIPTAVNAILSLPLCFGVRALPGSEPATYRKIP